MDFGVLCILHDSLGFHTHVKPKLKTVTFIYLLVVLGIQYRLMSSSSFLGMTQSLRSYARYQSESTRDQAAAVASTPYPELTLVTYNFVTITCFPRRPRRP